MTDDRASLGARIAEAMGYHNTGIEDAATGPLYSSEARPFEVFPPENLVSWAGYGIVDAWMREQGWKKHVMWLSNSTVLVDYWRGFGPPGQHMDTDEPLAALQAALKALESSDDNDS